MNMKYESEMDLEDELEAIMAAGEAHAKEDSEIQVRARKVLFQHPPWG